VAQQAGTTPRQTQGAPAARLARWALRAIISVKIEAADLNTGTIEPGAVATATFTVPEGSTEFKCTFHRGMAGTIQSGA
jgi:plastocyanin